MTEPNEVPKDLMEEIMNRSKLGAHRSHSETSLQNFGEDEHPHTPEVFEDPGVQNVATMNGSALEPAKMDDPARRRTVSQPGPISGSLLTATAARAARKKNVNYALSDSDKFKIQIPRDDSGTATPTGDKNGTLPPMYSGSFQRNADLRSLSNYRPYNSAAGTPRKRSVATMDAQSIRSVETHAPPPTSTEDNKKLTKKYLTLIISTMYAILLVTLGFIIYLGDVFVQFSVASTYSIALTLIGFLYHVYLIIDIQRYKSAALKNQKTKCEYEEKMQEYFRKQEEEYGTGSPGDRTPDGYRHFPAPSLVPIKHDYCFNQGRHSGSFYLKLGAAGFALGNLVHSVLLITVQVAFLFDENIDNEHCIDYVRLTLDIIHPVYCFLQLFFVFKYSNVIILKGQGVARFAFMHMIGSSLCFWISAIVRETILALTIYAQYLYGSGEYDEYEDTTRMNATTTAQNIFDMENNRFFNISDLYDETCVGSAAVSAIFDSFSPYLYPFSIEFNILIVAVYYIIWSNIGNCHSEDTSNSETNTTLEDSYSVCKIPIADEDNDYTSNMVIYADCHASNKGLFLGLVVMVIIVGMLIVGFVFSSVGGEFIEIGYIVNNATKLGLHGLMLFASILAFTQTTKLDINEHPISLLDDILLFICLPPFFMETVFSLIATLTILNITNTVDYTIMVIQVLVQTPLIIDALRRCSNSRKLRRQKPGRELIMFLLITNVAMWLLYTFSYKSPDSLDERYEFYGKVLWTILGHVSLPLIMFYRFHSSVCFADIWDSAYKPGSEH
ncbi:proton channel OtopLc-like [Pectinophora gossypiella]|uniref:Otopetrin n=1 Tax=Pectinophora gossypiella TaxID=13191 RepID=A0A1E1WB55_PECGO|nr:proton channel OtopLc-like [Pectinophora gossypiella]